MAIETLGQLLKARRAEAGLTQAEAALAAGVSMSTWTRAEQDTRTPYADSVASMARVVGATPGQLEKLGLDVAADMLRHAADFEFHQSPADEAAQAAVTNAAGMLTDAGWRVTLIKPLSDERGLIVLELRRDRATRADGAIRTA